MKKWNRLDERLYRQYMEFFEKAERDRRWNIFTDIPWDKVNPDASEDLAWCAETFMAVELYLPDYVAEGINCVRDSFGQAWFQANWGYEESKHALSLGEYLVRSGKRTKDQLFDYQRLILARTWEKPHATGRAMTCYGIVQEMATFVIYCKHRAYAAKEKDECLRVVYDYIARDEVAHAHFYEDVIKVLLEEDRPGTIADLAHVFRTFEMPGERIIPDYDKRIERMRAAGIDRNVFVQKVYNPVLKTLGITREEVKRAMQAARAGRKARTDAPEPAAAR